MNAAVLKKIDVSPLFRFFANYGSAVFLSWLGYYFFTEIALFHLDSFRFTWEPQLVTWKSGYVFTVKSFWRSVLLVYVFCLPVYFYLRNDTLSKGALVLQSVLFVLTGRLSVLTERHKLAVRFFLVKMVFVPYILAIFLAHLRVTNYKLVDLWRYFHMDVLDRPFFAPDLNWLIIECVLAVVYFFDVVPFLVGYLAESKFLNNEIKSVETTLAGWVICLIYYSPFNLAFAAFFVRDVPEYVHPFAIGAFGDYLYFILNVGAVLCLACYASASVSLGWRSGNLVSRGVVTSGLYSVVRHPAYSFKSVAWLLFALGASLHSYLSGQPWLWRLVALSVWVFGYYLRAVTEERHLSGTDPDYLTYMQSVPYRFIPRIF
ncbi:methyltransferase family protein [Undibacterium oligocarboniphilum]|uniref:Protein-S-isoprenylcysteine O-methyltransferase Ste14 n=1 Tax=Undibacterium oligocarboniphilum TaxID=666702 RepID=A0A850QT13_9BURK|nr:hypothetical protein [Undibacterium oligocarboniphilum]MBC3871912.1 hypothetical protein [Undibacterium oligocarboniphilum]NVO79504.1 hypothetical protein [Undibacterium oligocarboniphilum]